MTDRRLAAQWGAAIRARRLALNISQTRLAARLEIDQTTISRWETGRLLPPAGLLPRIARALDTTPDTLFQWPGEAA